VTFSKVSRIAVPLFKRIFHTLIHKLHEALDILAFAMQMEMAGGRVNLEVAGEALILTGDATASSGITGGVTHEVAQLGFDLGPFSLIDGLTKKIDLYPFHGGYPPVVLLYCHLFIKIGAN
jgi:hypothetical protein